jgi:hypothetical protein
MVPGGSYPGTGDTRRDALSRAPEISPGPFFSLIHGAVRGARMLAAVEAGLSSGVFDALSVPRTVGDLAGLLSLEAGVLGTLCDIYADAGLLKRQGDRFVNTPLTATFLTGTSPYSQAGFVRKEFQSVFTIWAGLSRILREGPVDYSNDEFFAGRALVPMAENALAGRLQAIIRVILGLQGISSVQRALDLGGGHGLYAIALAESLPHCDAFVMDLPGVTPLTESYIRVYNMERVHVISGNFFTDPLGDGYGLIFSSSNPSGKVPEMVPKIAAALAPGGYFVNLQPDGRHRDDLLSTLEWQLWTIDGEVKTRGARGNGVPFPDETYRQALKDSGLVVIGEHRVRDWYQPDFWLSLVVVQKPGTLPGGKDSSNN